MAIIGIVAEYNPFHSGHARHIALSKKPEDTVVCCMSGHFVQRGDCAITDKWRRAKWALMGGADLVVELPSPFALASAEGFSRKALEVLGFAGITHLSFGCETADLPALQQAASALNSPEYYTEISPFLANGVTFPAARQLWLAEKLGKEPAALIAQPNNGLAVEYLRFLPKSITPIAIPRTGAHDGAWTPDSPFPPSASALRRRIKHGENIGDFIPSDEAFPIFRLENAERAILGKLRSMSLEELRRVEDSGEGVAQRLYGAVRSERTLSAVLSATKSRHITLARVRRVVLRSWLDLSPNEGRMRVEDGPNAGRMRPVEGRSWAEKGPIEGGLRADQGRIEGGSGAELVPDRPKKGDYLRVLGMTAAGAAHLKKLKAVCPVPIITKPADHKELLAEESRLTDQFALCGDEVLPCGEEFRHSPIFFP